MKKIIISFQDMTAFTPPPESWIIRYNQNQQQQQQNQQPQKQSSVKEEKSRKTSLPFVPGANQLEAACKSYIESAEIPVKSNKALGTDDHFKSMVCSKNLLKVCEKLMTNKEFANTNTNTDKMYEGDDDFDAELSLMNEKSRMEYYRSKYGNRRNSQSLPASPKMERKNPSQTVAYNPYFTISKPIEPRQPSETSSISFLTNLFGITAKKPTSELQSNAAAVPSSALTQKTDNNDNLVDKHQKTFSAGDSSSQQQYQEKMKKPKMIPQPHEYREMNFWSPTSM